MNQPVRSVALVDLVRTVEELFPGTAVTHSSHNRGPSTFRLVPGTKTPRMLVPAGNNHAAAQSLVRPSAADSFRKSAPRQLLSLLLSTRLGRVAMPHGLTLAKGNDAPDSIADYLCAVVGQPVLLSLTVGSTRANRKPVLNVHSESGREIGFVKVGLNELTNRLVQHEGNTLGKLHAKADKSLTVPQKLHAGLWNDHEVLLMTALRPDTRQRRHQFPRNAAAAIVRSSPITYHRVSASSWLAGLRTEMEPLFTVPDSRLPELLERFDHDFGDVEIPFGAWHGDFGPWNLAHTTSVPMVWDWERYNVHVPVGLDVVHYISHQDLRKPGAYGQARHALESRALPELEQFILHTTGADALSPRQLHAILIGYLLTIATRFTIDGLTADGRAVRALASWHQDLVLDQMDRATSRRLQEK